MEAHLTPLIRKLQSIAPVSDDEKQAIAALPITVRECSHGGIGAVPTLIPPTGYTCFP